MVSTTFDYLYSVFSNIGEIFGWFGAFGSVTFEEFIQWAFYGEQFKDLHVANIVTGFSVDIPSIQACIFSLADTLKGFFSQIKIPLSIDTPYLPKIVIPLGSVLFAPFELFLQFVSGWFRIIGWGLIRSSNTVFPLFANMPAFLVLFIYVVVVGFAIKLARFVLSWIPFFH